jgi:hypothetical protein
MKDDGVHTAFELILEEIGSVSNQLKQEAKSLVDKDKFDAVSDLMGTGKKLDEFQVKVRKLQTEWINSFDPNVRSKTHFEIGEVDLKLPEVLSLTMTYGDAVAEAIYLGKSVKILEGSTVKRVLHESLADNIREKRKKALQKGDLIDSGNTDLYRLKIPVTFNSPSAAAQFVAGCSVSGPREWQIKGKGKSLKYWIQNKIGV